MEWGLALSAFDDKSKNPQAGDLKTMLGRSGSHWDRLVAHLATGFPPLDMTWNFSGSKWGWSLRLKQKKRTVLYLTPCRRHFLAGFALGENAVKAAHDLPLPGPILAVIDSAPKYAEGRGVRVEVRNKKDLEAVMGLATVKMAN